MSVRIALLGCGTVGGGVVSLLAKNKATVAARVGAPVEIVRVLVRDAKRERVPELDRSLVTTDAEAVLSDPNVDIVVELMGGVDPAGGLVERALRAGRSVVTANKMLLAHRGPDLLAIAKESGADLAFEGAVGGGIPIVRTLREAMAGDRVLSMAGIVNGTCNYILTRMRRGGLSFEAALKEAQDLGYAEADPELDVGGHDAAHKLVVLSMLAFGFKPESKAPALVEGIRDLDSFDHETADRFGYTIKHLAVGKRRDDRLELRAHPTLVPREATIANVGGVLNAISFEGEALGPCLLSGRGAGDMPTAVSVVADLVDVARAHVGGAKGLATKSLELGPRPLVPVDEIECAYYLRFRVLDRPGVLAHITGALGEAQVSIEQMVQFGGGDARGASVEVVMLTHVAREGAVRTALSRIATADFVAHPPKVLRVLDRRAESRPRTTEPPRSVRG
ncbi:MAG: homoserine dehydrogenase [Polyangiaceae bacterium]